MAGTRTPIATETKVITTRLVTLGEDGFRRGASEVVFGEELIHVEGRGVNHLAFGHHLFLERRKKRTQTAKMITTFAHVATMAASFDFFIVRQ
jgi:hypothetical protein